MTYIVMDPCIKCKFMDCVDVCPVDCFYEGENFLAINPDECIDCGVCEPECPVEAIKLLDQYAGSIVLLFTDVEMPGGPDGFELAQTTARRWPDISIVVASGGVKPGPDDLPEGAVFLNKPFSAQMVHDHLDKILPDGRKPEPLKARRK